MKRTDGRLVKIVGGILQNAHDLAEWGLGTGNLTENDLQMMVLKRDPRLRREAALKLIESGVSQRQTARLLGVNHKTIQRDVAQGAPESGAKCATGSAATKAHRAEIAAAAAEGGVTPAPTKKYRIVCADPPWSYGNTQPDYHSEQRDHYPVMELAEICEVPVESWAEDDAVLFLWVTAPILEESFQVVRAWGFEYKTCFVWDKIKHNMGHYNSLRHELLLICTRGSCQPDVKQLFDSVQNIERGKHSEKPAEFFNIIETLYTHGRRLQMFGRQSREGWDDYGHVAELEVRDAAE